MICELCEAKADPTSELFHWNGPGRSHCNHCHASWRQTSNAMHCIHCHRTFASPAICDNHDIEGRCVDPDTLDMEPDLNRWGTIIWRRPTMPT